MSAVRGAVPAGEPLVFHRYFAYNAVFYWGDRIPVLENALAPPDGAASPYILVWQADWDSLAAEAKQHVEMLLSSAPAIEDEHGALLLVRRRN
jgi:hypothetical protein